MISVPCIILFVVFLIYFAYWILGLILIKLKPSDRQNVKDCFFMAPIGIFIIIFVLLSETNFIQKLLYSYWLIVNKLFGKDE